ncbi:hypothetical protein GCM10011359_28130 [Nesterenkonia alkaliphila]|nr:hypothetical protein GCM10011359_28130 [Nesterenkonia alkaliphila]
MSLMCGRKKTPVWRVPFHVDRQSSQQPESALAERSNGSAIFRVRSPWGHIVNRAGRPGPSAA